MSDEGLTLMRTGLSAAVPLWIEELWRVPAAEVEVRARRALAVVAAHGDDALYRSCRQGESARAFNALAEAVACLAFASGGVTAFGLHFEARKEGRDGEEEAGGERARSADRRPGVRGRTRRAG